MNEPLLTVKEAARRYNCSETAFRHKVRARQIDPKYVDRSGRSIRIRPELFTIQEPASNLLPFGRTIDMDELADKLIARMIANPALAKAVADVAMRPLFDQLMGKAS
jgi:hypothetical protein